jgi:hypothetical protein
VDVREPVLVCRAGRQEELEVGAQPEARGGPPPVGVEGGGSLVAHRMN